MYFVLCTFILMMNHTVLHYVQHCYCSSSVFSRHQRKRRLDSTNRGTFWLINFVKRINNFYNNIFLQLNKSIHKDEIRSSFL